MKTITATVPAFITSGTPSFADLPSMVPAAAVNALTFYQTEPEYVPDHWVRVGTAEITISLDNQEEVVTKQIAVLKEAKAKLQAETQMKLTAIDEQIGKLLCLEHKPEGAAL